MQTQSGIHFEQYCMQVSYRRSGLRSAVHAVVSVSYTMCFTEETEKLSQKSFSTVFLFNSISTLTRSSFDNILCSKRCQILYNTVTVNLQIQMFRRNHADVQTIPFHVTRLLCFRRILSLLIKYSGESLFSRNLLSHVRNKLSLKSSNSMQNRVWQPAYRRPLKAWDRKRKNCWLITHTHTIAIKMTDVCGATENAGVENAARA